MITDRDPGDEQPVLWMVFDVEAVGLHGPAFAVGWVVVDRAGVEREASELWTPPKKLLAADDDQAWVAANVTHNESAILCSDPAEVRARFWDRWMYWKERGALLAADVPWPVESSFLSECVGDVYSERIWAGPYPLLDVASVRYAIGLDPLAAEPRHADELPAHCALADARQSARLLLEALAL